MPLFAYAAPIQPNKTAEFRQYVANLRGAGRKEYEESRQKAGFSRESIFLQQTPLGEVVVVVQEADNEQNALAALRGMIDSYNVSYFQRTRDINGYETVGPDTPRNELLLDFRSDTRP
jgi:Family of unknown function (DUF6176)